MNLRAISYDGKTFTEISNVTLEEILLTDTWEVVIDHDLKVYSRLEVFTGSKVTSSHLAAAGCFIDAKGWRLP